ncbi:MULTISPECIES: ribosome recycling factor [Afifella]|uniref:Ribosome-recycling factor n=1 Tax=Afifella marina DSM 2698 TaxID=1120955 RepID=A0A1G5NL45_AFIMA|nr:MULTISPECIES: ribosome recycling factor [Afifella]MBK1623672.1 ribosome recycling factor [Afifella marina DSM 2698]MBK1626665.1 ribosome recycling factor [Afifella marina]MBK5916214.1 ribosome recycling factor [Afifella marina]MCF1502711.1 ribosome recycling factor [Afifella sp. H1R]RAI21589.1 ribosome recycling factor [Afifella marina DSM 2698]
MSEGVDFKDIKRRMDGAVSVLRTELAGLRTGRASPNLLDPITVSAYGSQMPISQVGTVSVPESRMLSVQVWDQSLVGAVDRAIRDSNLGLNPIMEGTLLRIPIPELNAERRQEMVKVAHKYAENARVAVRHVRRDGMEALKKSEKDGEISQDESRGHSDRIQSLTDEHIAAIDDMLGHKEKEIMQV